MVETQTKYPNPPILETICEVHFDLPAPLTLQKIESLKDVWSSEYPEQKVVEDKECRVSHKP